MPHALRPALQSALLRAWAGRGLTACLLWPISFVFSAMILLRRQLYSVGWFKTRQVDALVIVVGNVVAGGAGKTPTAIALLHHLRARGHRAGLVSRGYGRTHSDCREVMPDSLPQDVGDEPLLIQRATRVPIFVGRTRNEAATALLAKYPETEIILCDDGLQHYGLFRDLEVCVFDDRGIGNGWLLPAGPLREGWPRQAVAKAGQRGDRLFVLHTGRHPAFAGYVAQRALAPFAVRSDGSTIPLTALTGPGAKLWVAVAGIAQPESFFSMLRALHLPLVQTVGLPDHYAFDSLPRSIDGGYSIICTEKDAAKLWQLAPDALAIPLVLTIEAAFFEALDACISERLDAKLSSVHGHKTT